MDSWNEALMIVTKNQTLTEKRRLDESALMSVCGSYGTLGNSADTFQARKSAMLLQPETIQVLSKRNRFSLPFILRSPPHTRLCTGKHLLAG